MNNETNQKTAASARPSLSSKPSLSAPQSRHAEDWEDSRILSSSKMGALTKTPKRPASKVSSLPPSQRPAARSSSSLGFYIVAGLGALAIAAVFGYQYVLNSPVGKHPAKAETPMVVVAPAAPAVVPEPPADNTQLAQAGTEPAQSQAAQIINEPPPVAPAAPTAAAPTPATLTTALENGVKPPPAALEKALQASPAAVPAAVAAAPVREKAATAPLVVASAKPAVAPARAPAAAPSAAPVPVGAAAEKDVNLLAAIVAHNSAKAAAQNAAATPAASAADTSRPAEESAESLLRRCSTLEAERQAACRVKACSGPRAGDAACKQIAAAPTPVAASAPAPAPAAAAPAPSAPTIPTEMPTLPALPALPAVPLLAPSQ